MSAMTALRKDSSDVASYLDLAQFLSNQGAPSHRAGDLRQLYTRAVFNVATGNRDDHLRNHGFLLTADGWRLAPAFDVNPAPDKETHVLALDDGETRPRMETVVQTAELYGLTKGEGQRIVDHVAAHVRPWRREAARLGISAADIELTAPAFDW
jgi:serine/threonine-protein kinase HipA